MCSETVAWGDKLPESVARMSLGSRLSAHSHSVRQCRHCVILVVSLPVLVLLLIGDCDLTVQSHCTSVSISGKLNELGYNWWHLKTAVIHRRAGEGRRGNIINSISMFQEMQFMQRELKRGGPGSHSSSAEVGLKSASPEPEACTRPSYHTGSQSFICSPGLLRACVLNDSVPGCRQPSFVICSFTLFF